MDPASAAAAVEAVAALAPICDDSTDVWTLPDGTRLVIDEDGHRLWLGGCDKPGTGEHAAPKLIAAFPDAYFGGHVSTPDGAVLFVRDDGIWRVDLATAESRHVYQPPSGEEEDCAQIRPKGPSGEDPRAVFVDTIAGTADNGATLIVHRRGTGCHYPAAFDVRITDWRDPAKAREHIARPIYDLIADGDVVYFVDGDGIWSTRDGRKLEKIWVRLAKPDPDARDVVVAQVIARGNTLIARTGEGEIAEGWRRPDFGGFLLRSTNRGKTWTPIALPEGVYQINWIAASSKLDTLEVGTGQAPEPPEGAESPEPPADTLEPRRGVLADGTPDLGRPRDQPAVDEIVYTSKNGGRTWKAGVGKRPAFARSITTKLGTFEATDDGLYLTPKTGARTRITPELAKPLWADRF